MICPLCVRQSNNMIYCPEQKKLICDKHCRDCPFFSGYKTSIAHCYFRERAVVITPDAKSK